jgi:hypothetical protein
MFSLIINFFTIKYLPALFPFPAAGHAYGFLESKSRLEGLRRPLKGGAMELNFCSKSD